METRQRRRLCLAQNFLRSPKLVHLLVGISKIGPGDIVYEIGPGNGIITAELARIARHVIAIEKDPELVHHLRERFRPLDNVEIVEKDFLEYVFRNPGSGYKIFGNIPYNITAQIVRKILWERTNLGEAHLILQKEAAKKFSGSPKESLCSILGKPFFEFDILYQLRRTDFRPVPAVDSVLLSIKRRTRPLIEMHEVASYVDFVQYGFGRWKPNLKLAFKTVFTYKQWKRLARDLHFPLNATPTELSFEQWLGLYRGFRNSNLYELTVTRAGPFHED
jgi:23S rRNA (adenine-N6)-dimethyltransferase